MDRVMRGRALMLEQVKKLEHWVTLVLVALLCTIVVLATVELAVTTAKDIVEPPVLFPGIDKLLDLFGRVLLVVIGLELIETMRVFAAEGVVRVEVVLTVAMTALARRVIVLEPEHVSAPTLFAIAALLVALSVAYLAFVRRHRPGS
jgi:uncharacterized membrane protein (DUF373 family)